MSLIIESEKIINEKSASENVKLADIDMTNNDQKSIAVDSSTYT